MHRSSKQRALIAAMCAVSFATGSFVFGQESAPVRKKLPTRPVMPAALTKEVEPLVIAVQNEAAQPEPACSRSRSAVPLRTGTPT